MELTYKAIRARFNGNLRDAANYCANLAAAYPNLRDEYYQLADRFLIEMGVQ